MQPRLPRRHSKSSGRVLIATPSQARRSASAKWPRFRFRRGPAMIRDEDGALTGYVYLDLNTQRLWRLRRAGRAAAASRSYICPPATPYKWSGEYEFELRAKQRLKLILPVVVLRDLPAALYGVPFRGRGAGADLPHALCDDRRPDSAMVSWLQLQRRGLGWLHRAVRNRRRDRRRHGRLSARSAGPAACRRCVLLTRRRHRSRPPSKAPSSACVPS